MDNLKEVALTAALVIGPFGLVAALLDSDPEAFSGRLDYGWQEVRSVDLGEDGGRRLAFAEGRGRYTGNGGDVLDGATVSVTETVDTVRGLGTLRGYLLFEKHGSTAVARWTATLTGSIADGTGEAQSVTGSWTLVTGTGKLSDVSGRGMIQGRRNGGQTTVTLTGSLDGMEAGPRGVRSLAQPAVATPPGSRLPGA